MLKIVVLDTSAQSRNKLTDLVSKFLDSEGAYSGLIPRASIKPLSPNEIKFHAAPDICIVGEEIVSQELTELHSIRAALPDSALIVCTPASLQNLSSIQQLARLGADDTMSLSISAEDFLKKIILLNRKKRKESTGKLFVVDSGKGGLGVSSIAAALAEALLDSGKKVALIDLDFETQDLSRFLQVRPFVNENLQLLFNGNRPVTEEFVQECLIPVWRDEPNLVCMPPLGDSEELYDFRASYPRTLVAILEVLDSLFDCVVVDTGAARGNLLKTLYRLADHAIYLVNNDPATLYPAVDRVSRLRFQMSPEAKLHILENNTIKGGLSSKFLKEEFLNAASLTADDWICSPVPFSPSGSRWPASGLTLFSLGNSAVVKSLKNVLAATKIVNEQEEQGAFLSAIAKKSRTILPGNKSGRAFNTGRPARELASQAAPRGLPLPGQNALARAMEANRLDTLKAGKESSQDHKVPDFYEEADVSSLVSGVRIS